jgi:hypothetical protein
MFCQLRPHLGSSDSNVFWAWLVPVAGTAVSGKKCVPACACEHVCMCVSVSTCIFVLETTCIHIHRIVYMCICIGVSTCAYVWIRCVCKCLCLCVSVWCDMCLHISGVCVCVCVWGKHDNHCGNKCVSVVQGSIVWRCSEWGRNKRTINWLGLGQDWTSERCFLRKGWQTLK